MRLSDAIALGRTLGLDLCKGGKKLFVDNNNGCALDMAVLAVNGGKDWHDAVTIWPWLDNLVKGKSAHWKNQYIFDIAARFDKGVMNGVITLDELIDYVRSVEPAEEISVDTMSAEEVEYASVT